MRILIRGCLSTTLVLAALLGASCADSGAPTTQPVSEERPSRAEFLAEVRPPCRNLDKSLEYFQGPSTFPAELDDYGSNASKYVSFVEGDISALSQVTPPAEYDAQWEELVSELNRSVEKANLVVDLVEAKNDDTDALGQAWTDNKTARSRVMELAAEIEIGACEKLVAEGGH